MQVEGDQVVEKDLLASCISGHIANAILDVYEEEPLPENHNFGIKKILEYGHMLRQRLTQKLQLNKLPMQLSVLMKVSYLLILWIEI